MKPMVLAPWGEEKTCKTTLALSFPKPLFHFDVDVGGYDRAAWRIDTEGVTSEKFYQPMKIEKMMGQEVTEATKPGQKLSIRFPKKEVGMRELWQQIIRKYVEVLQDPTYKTIVFDSFTLMWNICHRSHLQEIQEKQIAKTPNVVDNDLRESLMPKEYGPANDRMRSIISNSRSMGKNLIITHYPKDVYGVRVTAQGTEDYRTGAIAIDGFKEVAKLIDIAISTTTEMRGTPKVKTPVCTITTCGLEGLGIAAEGIELPTPDYAGLMALVELFRG